MRAIRSQLGGESAVTCATTILATMTEPEITPSNQWRSDQCGGRADRCPGTSEQPSSAVGPLPAQSAKARRLLVLVLTWPVTITVLAVTLGIFGVVLRLF